MSHLFWCQWSHCILMKTPPHPHPHPCPRCWCWWQHHTFCCHLETAVPISRRRKVMLGLASRPRDAASGGSLCQLAPLKPLVQAPFPHLKMMCARAPGWGLGAMEKLRACSLVLTDSKNPGAGTRQGGMVGCKSCCPGEAEWLAEQAIPRG